MKLIQDFKDFLASEVNLNPTRLKTLDERVAAVTNFLRDSDTFKDVFIDVVPQGSFAHKTIIKPVRDNDEFDADVLLHVEEVEDWEPEDYVNELYACFRSSSVYKDKVAKGKRCVTVDYANDFHMDVVPYMERHGNKYITCRPTNQFERTDPEQYNAWLEEQNRITGRNLVKVIRLVKYLRNYKGTFDVKSVVLNVLLGNQVNEAALLEDPSCYADVPTTLKTVMGRLSDYVRDNENLPTIEDPSGTGENFSDRWNQEGYASFRTAIMRYAEWIEDAWSDEEPESSRKKWQKVFGENFGKGKAIKATESRALAIPVDFKNTEERIENLGFPLRINPAYRFRINGKVLRKDGFSSYYLRDRGNKVLRNRKIRFEIEECNVPGNYKILWKVLNRGELAVEGNCIRGQIEEGERQWRLDESTSFAGSHYVECYIVKDGFCVAKDRQPVNISY